MVALSGSWGRLAPSLVAMVHEADRMAPKRRKASDGSIGDAAHAARTSFHNPSGGYVDALDLTHDPAGGFDAHALARRLIARGDNRLDHVISNRQIWSAVRPYWRAYTGANPHTLHVHFAVKRNSTGRNPTSAWWPTPPPAEPIPPEDDMPYQLLEVTDGTAKGQVWMVTPAGPVHVLNVSQLHSFRESGIASKSKPAPVGSHQITTWLANIAGKRNA